MCFAGCGVWHPDSPTLGRIRDAIVERPEEWTRITTGAAFCQTFRLAGEALKRPPRGYDPEHPLIEDLKRKDFVVIADVEESEAVRPRLPRPLRSDRPRWRRIHPASCARRSACRSSSGTGSGIEADDTVLHQRAVVEADGGGGR